MENYKLYTKDDKCLISGHLAVVIRQIMSFNLATGICPVIIDNVNENRTEFKYDKCNFTIYLSSDDKKKSPVEDYE